MTVRHATAHPASSTHGRLSTSNAAAVSFRLPSAIPLCRPRRVSTINIVIIAHDMSPRPYTIHNIYTMSLQARKLRGSDKVAARKAQAVADDHEAIERFNADGLEARNIDDAIAMLASSNLGSDGTNASGAGGAAGAGGSDDAHPEKRMKASFARFKERELPLIKAEYPTLRMTQHLDMLKRKWDKSPENPLVQAERAKAAEGASWKEK